MGINKHQINKYFQKVVSTIKEISRVIKYRKGGSKKRKVISVQGRGLSEDKIFNLRTESNQLCKNNSKQKALHMTALRDNETKYY